MIGAGSAEDGQVEPPEPLGVDYSVYHDRFRRTPDGWKFTERVFEIRYLDTTRLAGSAVTQREVPASLRPGRTA